MCANSDGFMWRQDFQAGGDCVVILVSRSEAKYILQMSNIFPNIMCILQKIQVGMGSSQLGRYNLVLWVHKCVYLLSDFSFV